MKKPFKFKTMTMYGVISEDGTLDLDSLDGSKRWVKEEWKVELALEDYKIIKVRIEEVKK